MHRSLLLIATVCGLLAGCSDHSSSSGSTYDPYADSGYDDYRYGSGEITFLEAAPANVADIVGLSDLTLTDKSGESTRVRDLAAERGAVVVVTRGNTNPICPYCSTQTANYIRDYERFSRRGVEVILVYPIEARADQTQLDAFLADARGRLEDQQRPVPFPVLFDVELTAVNQLGIKKDLSKPATYVVDASGHVQYAYVGAHLADRPAVSAVLKTLEELGISDPESSDQNKSADGGDDSKE